jgi:uncharacterized protein (TIGR03083 family)
MTLPYDAVDQIRRDGGAFIKLMSEHDGTASVPSCPDWSLADLAWHVGGVWSFWASIVERRIVDVTDLRTIDRPARPEGADGADGGNFIDVLYDAHVRLCTTLHDSPDDTPVWTWTGAPRDVAWVQRRMAQEIAIHLWDATSTTGEAYTVPSVVAADGIDEFLMWFAAADRNEGAMKVGGTVHLHCTDTDLGEVNGEWYVAAMKEPAATFTREHRKADAAIRGNAHDLLLWLWRRGGNVDVLGDDVVARRFQAFTDLG